MANITVTTTVITPKQAQALVKLVQAGVFNIKNGQAVLHFNHDGEMMQVDIRYIGYKKLSPEKTIGEENDSVVE